MNFKNYLIILLFTAFCIKAVTASGQQKGVICLGNGEMCVYEDQANIIQLFGPPYTSPSVLELLVNNELEVESEREFGTAIWNHTLKNRRGTKVGTLTDFVSTVNTSFVRSVDNQDAVQFILKLPAETKLMENTPAYRDYGIVSALRLMSPAGTYAYQNVFYPTATANYYEFIVTGDAKITQMDNSSWFIECKPGKSTLYVTSSREYPDFITNTKAVLENGYETLLEQTRKDWMKFTAEGIDYNKILSKNVPQRERLLQAIDDVAVIIKTQQATEGSVLAGYNYHLGYVRDQYGVSRGLIKLGHVKEAVEMMDFYWDIWKRKGVIRNAQGIGLDAFHVHENDEVEITGYLVIQAFDLLKATGDNNYIKKIFPMLEWAFDCQVRNLARHMLPFNGDETYIAGGILPRTVMLDGSAEATMLFITGSEQLIAWARKNKMWDKSTLTNNTKIVSDVRNHYAENFIEDGKLLTNNPDRKIGLEYPEFRHGVCESCYKLDWSHRTYNNRYICAECFAKKSMPDVEDEKFYLKSVSLLPWYIESDVVPYDNVKALVKEAAGEFSQTGRLPSRPDGNRNLGYDYGLFLFSLTQIDDPVKDNVYEQMLSIIDPSGAWVEYYENGVPSGTLCRPWESAINIEAAIDYAESYGR